MRAFEYAAAHTVDEALASIGPDAKFLAGGTNLVDLMKGEVERPARLVDINALPLAEITPLPSGGVRIGAMVRNSDCAADALIRDRYPLLTQALVAGASPQLRNMASTGGNLLQRTRCYYFYDTAFDRCNKRNPGSGCAAREGYNRIHAILGASEQCVATHPSDMAVALAALDAVVEVRSRTGSRRIPLADFHRLPGDTPQRDTNLEPGELIVAVELPPNAFAQRSHYLKVRDRASYAFALVSVAAALEMDGNTVRGARIALGGVAHKPWRAVRAEKLLAGGKLDAPTLAKVAQASVEGAMPLKDNAFKVDLAKRSVVRALQQAGGVA
ncbi:MAG TPA: xanthine dehydrogenase family protein subunit M [Usitatibacter sp.]|nr:xanthine dehydrogenase family protein subunit M [Usitatibacter sp.]